MDVNVKLTIPAAEQLLKLLSSGIGAVAGPMLARWQARVRADDLRIEAQGKADSIDLITAAQVKANERLNLVSSSATTEVDIREEIIARLTFQEEKRQRNIETVVRKAATELGEHQVDDVDVDHDWTASFFTDVQDVSTEQMQELWARILAGEVRRSGTTSMRTLSILKVMSQADATLFQNVTPFVIEKFVLSEKEYTRRLTHFPQYSDFLRLAHHDLFHIGMGLVTKLNGRSEYILDDIDVAYRIFREDGKTFDIDIPTFTLSQSGRELYKFAKQGGADEEYLKEFSRFLFGMKQASLASSRVIGRDEEIFRVGTWLEIAPNTIIN